MALSRTVGRSVRGIDVRVIGFAIAWASTIAVACVPPNAQHESSASNDAPTSGGDDGSPTSGDDGDGDDGVDDGDGDGGSAGDDGEPTVDCIEIDKADQPVIVPPAGVRVNFRVLDCDGNALPRPLTDEDVRVINDEQGEEFGVGGEGGSKSNIGLPSNIDLRSILVLDFSDSIFNANAVDAVVDGALTFVDELVTKPEGPLKHSVAILAFGSTNQIELVQGFTDDDATLMATLEALRMSDSRGTTNLYDAYIQALQAIAAEEVPNAITERFMVIMTDGTHEAGNEDELRTQALNEKQFTDATVYSIGIQGNYDEAKLRELATGCSADDTDCDNFLNVEDASTLSEAFAAVSERALALATSNYVIGVCTPVELGSPTLTIDVDFEGATDSVTVAYPTDALTGDVTNCDPQQVAGGGVAECPTSEMSCYQVSCLCDLCGPVGTVYVDEAGEAYAACACLCNDNACGTPVSYEPIDTGNCRDGPNFDLGG